MQRAKDVHQMLLHLHARKHWLLLLLAVAAAAAAADATCYKCCMLRTIYQRPTEALRPYSSTLLSKHQCRKVRQAHTANGQSCRQCDSKHVQQKHAQVNDAVCPRC
jgi:hypothetical protein